MTSAVWDLTFDDGRIIAQLEAGADEAAYAVGEHILDESNRHVPFELGDLERSGRVSGPENGAANVVYDSVYAARQHEELTWQHDAGRTAKFLENALNSQASAALSIMAQEMQL